MKLCICRKFNECQARDAIATMSPEDRISGPEVVSVKATEKEVRCGLCLPRWAEIISEVNAQLSPA